MNYLNDYDNYPQSSCNCENCPQTPPIQYWPVTESGDVYTNNLGLLECEQLNDVKSCTSNNMVDWSKQPVPWTKDPIVILNKDFGLKKATNFFTDPNSRNNCETDNGVTAYDPRLIDVMRGGVYQTLDTAPYTGDTLLKNIYNEDLRNYGRNYTNYPSINAGQIRYYVDKDIVDPFFSPVSTIRSDVKTEMYVTPMTSFWPTYTKIPFTQDNRYISKQQFTRDTVSHREDLMARQMSVMNRQKFPL